MCPARPAEETDLRGRLESAMRQALRERDADRLRVLRTTLGAIANAEAVPVDAAASAWRSAPRLGATEAPRRELGQDEVAALVRHEAEERDRAAASYDGLDDADRATRLRAQARLLRELLPDAPGPG